MSFSKRHILFSLVIITFISVLFNIPIFAQEEITVINSYGIYTLEMLGYEDVVFEQPSDFEKKDFHYCLPDGAKQGPEDWYLIHISYDVIVSKDSGTGSLLISSLSNDYSSAQIEVITEYNDNGALVTTWNTVDLVNDYLEYSSQGLRASGNFTNYMQTSGIRQGKSTLSFQLETFGDIKVEKVIISKDSGIEFTSVSPPHLDLEAECRTPNAGVGAPIILYFSLTNNGDLPAKDVVVTARTNDDHLLTDTTEFRYSSIEYKEKVDGTFTFYANEDKSCFIYIRASAHGSSNSPIATFTIPVNIESSSGQAWIPLLIAMPTILILVIALLAKIKP